MVREPIDPAEIGRLYRLYLDSGMPLSLGDQARYLLAIDGEDGGTGAAYSVSMDHMGHPIASNLRDAYLNLVTWSYGLYGDGRLTWADFLCQAADEMGVWLP